MDNNNQNQMGQPNNNMQGQPGPMNQPNMMGQPGMMNQNMAGQPNMMGQPGMVGQPNMMGPNMPNQPKPKQPMDPAKKKKLIIGLSIGGVVLALGIAAAIVIPMLLKVDYGEAYRIAKELKPKISDLDSSYYCEYIVDYVNSDYISISSYADYVSDCQKSFDTSAAELVTRLENTGAVKRDSNLAEKFQKFKTAYDSVAPSNTDELNQKIALYVAYHSFVYAVDDISYRSTDAEIATAANYLINSGNETLKKYGEGWLEKIKALTAAYRAWDNASYSDPNYNAYYDAYTKLRSEYSDYNSENKPDITSMVPLEFGSDSRVYSDFNTFYSALADAYAENYDSNSGDCLELFGQVYCD